MESRPGTKDAAGRVRKFDLEQRLVEFALRIANIVEKLPDTRVGNHVGGQLLRCGKSPAANYGEAQAAESPGDFIHKLKVILKELRETRVWLVVIHRKALVSPLQEAVDAIAECNELTAIFVTSIRTARANAQKDAS